jgi:hypothetical protein
MECFEHIQLGQHYEAALQYWEHVILLPEAESSSTAGRLAAQIKRKHLKIEMKQGTECFFTSRRARFVLPT